MSPRTGRPTSNPKTARITVRLDKPSESILEQYCKEKQVDKAEAIRQGIMKLAAETKK